MKSQPRFIINIITYHWSCGDGCCSDSGYKLYVEDLKPEVKGHKCVIDNDDWDMNRCKQRLLEDALERIQEKIGRLVIKTDYKVKYSDDYSGEQH